MVLGPDGRVALPHTTLHKLVRGRLIVGILFQLLPAFLPVWQFWMPQ
jgi:hypothetical protein